MEFNFLNKGDTYSFVSIDEDKYFLVRAKRNKSNWTILNYYTNLSLSGDNASVSSSTTEVFEALKNIVNENKCAKDTCYIILPRHEVTSRIIILPSQDPEEVKNMVKLSAEEYVPFSAEEIQTTQTILENLPNAESRVLVAISHKDVVNGNIKAVESLGFTPLGVLVSTSGLLSAPTLLGKQLSIKNTVYCILHITLQGLEIAIFNEEKMLFSRGAKISWSKYLQNSPDSANDSVPSFSEGSEIKLTSLADMDESTSDLIWEIKREYRTSLNTLQQETEFEGEVKEVFVSSDFPLPQEFIADIENAFDVKTTFINFNLYGFIRAECDVPTYFSLPILGLLSAISAGKSLQLDLLPEEVATVQKLEAISHHLIRISALTLGLLIALAGLFAQAVYQRSSLISELEKRVKEIEVNAKGIAEKRHQLQILRRETAKTGSSLHYLSEIMSSAPPRVNINTYSYRRNEGINIWGRAYSVDDVHKFAESLRKQAIASGLNALKNARSVYEQQTTEQNAFVFDYQITVPFVEEEEGESGSVKSP